jgi:hypothetical protein
MAVLCLEWPWAMRAGPASQVGLCEPGVMHVPAAVAEGRAKRWTIS